MESEMNENSRQQSLALARERIHSLAFDLSLRNLAEALKDSTERAAVRARIKEAEAALAAAGSPRISEAASRVSRALRARKRPAERFEAALTELSDLLREYQKPEFEPAPPAEEAALNTPSLSGLALDPQILADFLLEAREHLANIDAQLLTLEQKPDDAEAMHSVFRSFHTMKGLAGFLELSGIQETAHEVETLLDKVRNNELAMTPAVIDAALAAGDAIGCWLEHLGGRAARPETHGALLEQVRALAEGRGPVEAEPAPASSVSGAVEESPTQASAPVRAARDETSAVRVETAKLEYLVDMVGELAIALSIVRHDPDLVGLNHPRLQRNMAQLTRVTTEVQKTAMAMRMVPIGQLFRKMARLVRDLARKSGKLAELETVGEAVEIDRRIVEELADPLVHMVRNSVDHGLEMPDERERAGKPRAGHVTLKAAHRAGTIEIEVLDDGRGLSREKILSKAAARGLVPEGAELGDREVWQLIFEPGFSTAKRVTDVSGRGVGMDIVRRHVEVLRGRIDIESAPGRGTRFLLKIPLTLAIIDGLVVEVGTERYIVPIFAVREIVRPNSEMLFTAEGRREMVLVRERLLPLLRLCHVLKLQPRSENPSECLILVIESQDRSYCLMVDGLLGKQEVVMKGLGETFRGVHGLAGAAILGDGRVRLILDVATLGLKG